MFRMMNEFCSLSPLFISAADLEAFISDFPRNASSPRTHSCCSPA
jgi:hypothetical protein